MSSRWAASCLAGHFRYLQVLVPVPVRLLVIGLLLLGVAVGPLCAREWTDKWGRKFTAELHEVTETQAIFVVNGRQRPMLLKNLSEADLIFIRKGPTRKVLNRKAPVRTLPAETNVQLHGSFKATVPQMTADMKYPVKLVERDDARKRWVYRTAHFEFVSDGYLGTDVVRDFSWIFEVTHDYVASLPVQTPRDGKAARQPLRTYLFSTKQAYVRAGAPPTSAGVFVPSRNAILVPFTSLGIVTTTAGSHRKKENPLANRVMQHEITHHLMRGDTQRAAWFIEGVAEYVATVPFSQNRLLLSHHQNSVVESVVGLGWDKSGGYNLGRTIEMPHLADFMQGSYSKFQRTKNSYPYSLMVFYYFARLDGKKDGARLKSYAELLLNGHPERDARAVLWAKRTDRQLEADFAKAWNQLGVTVKFPRR